MSTISKWLESPPDNFSTTLTTTSLSNSTLSWTLNSVSGLAQEGIGVLFQKDSAGVIDETTIEFVHWTSISGSTMSLSDTGDRGLSGSYNGAIAHSGTIYFEVWVSQYYYGKAREGFIAEHSQTGVHDGTKVVRVSSNDANLPDPSSNIQVNFTDPKRGIYIPATGLFPATTNGCASLAQGETTTNKINYKYLAFNQSTEEYAWIHLPTPDYWDLGTITVKFHWTAASGTGDVIWGAAGLCRSNDDALDTALGTAQTVTDTLIATGDEHTTSATSAITIGGTPAKGDSLYLRVYRDADAGGDTLNADAHLLGITVKFSIGQYDDA